MDLKKCWMMNVKPLVWWCHLLLVTNWKKNKPFVLKKDEDFWCQLQLYHQTNNPKYHTCTHTHTHTHTHTKEKPVRIVWFIISSNILCYNVTCEFRTVLILEFLLCNVWFGYCCVYVGILKRPCFWSTSKCLWFKLSATKDNTQIIWFCKTHTTVKEHRNNILSLFLFVFFVWFFFFFFQASVYFVVPVERL